MSTREGTPWGLGAVGCAQWTGVPLADVLQRAGLRPEGVEVIIESAEAGEIKGDLATPGRINVARSLPIKRVLAGDVLLAYKINNEDLPQQLGGPVRVVVPGWYGCAWVKWPQRIVVSGAPFEGYFQKFDCTVWERRNGFAVLSPVTELQPKAQIARPIFRERIRAKETYRVYGAAWTGDAEITGVEVSGDDGKTWANARACLIRPPKPENMRGNYGNMSGPRRSKAAATTSAPAPPIPKAANNPPNATTTAATG